MKPSYDFALLRPYWRIAVPLVIVLCVIDLVLTALAATPALNWVPEVVTGNGYLEDSRDRVVRAEDEYRNGRVGSQEHLAAFVGISNMRQAIDLDVVNTELGDGWRSLGVAGAGFGMASLSQYADLLLDSQLSPDMVVIGLGLHQLVDDRPRPAASQTGLTYQLMHGNFRGAAITARNATWIYARREDISISTESALLALRARMFRSFGVVLPESGDSKKSPWRGMLKSDWPDHFSDATLRAQEQFYRQIGIFDADAYTDRSLALGTLTGEIDRFYRRGARVILVLLPEHSSLYRGIPSVALSVLRRHLREHFEDREPPLLDFRRAINDSGFVDLPHLNRAGSATFSRELATALRERLPQTAPLMAVRGLAANQRSVALR